MSPVIVIVLISLGLICAYFLMTELGAAQVTTGAAPDSTLITYSILAIKILIVVLILYTIYYVLDVIRTSIGERKARARKAKALAAKERSYNR